MPLQNRVDPFGAIRAVPERGMWMGNRGSLHDAHRNITREWSRKAWIICLLEYRGRHRTVMAPGSYTELFFLDKATALAAGHRPCGTCQRERLREFTRLWKEVNPAGTFSLSALDERLHRERFASAGTSALWTFRLAALPGGTFVLQEGRQDPCLWDGKVLRPWSFAGYGKPLATDPDQEVRVLTPRSIVRVIAAGFTPQIAGRRAAVKPADTAPAPERRERPEPSRRQAAKRAVPAAGHKEPSAPPPRAATGLYRLKSTPRGKELYAYFAAILRVTGMEKGAVYPLNRFMKNFKGHLDAGRIERAAGGYRLTATGRDYFQDRYRPGNPQHVDESAVERYVRQIRGGGPGWEPIG